MGSGLVGSMYWCLQRYGYICFAAGATVLIPSTNSHALTFASVVPAPAHGSLLVVTPGICLVPDLSPAEYHHQGTKTRAAPQLTQYQW